MITMGLILRHTYLWMRIYEWEHVRFSSQIRQQRPNIECDFMWIPAEDFILLDEFIEIYDCLLPDSASPIVEMVNNLRMVSVSQHCGH